MESEDWSSLAAILALLAGSAFFSAAEVGLLRLGKYRLQHLLERSPRIGRVVQRLLAAPVVMLTAVLVSITAFNYAAETLGATWAISRLGHTWGPPVAVAALFIVVLLFAEVTPISYAAANPQPVVAAAAFPVLLVSWLLWLPVKVMTAMAEGLSRIIGGPPQPQQVTGEELKAAVDIGAEHGVLEEEEKELIHSIFEFGDKVAREVMVPRTDIVGVPADATVQQAAQRAIEHHVSRLPIYQEDLDNVVGVVHSKDLLPFLQDAPESPVAQVMRTPYLVPETKHISELLDEMRARKQWLALVVDEHGGTAGLVTIEDLLEEIVGEIYDEYDVEHPAVERLEDGSLRLDGRMTVREASELIGVELPTGDFDTLAGLLYDRLGSVPGVGDGFAHKGWSIAVDALEGHRITRALAKPEARQP